METGTVFNSLKPCACLTGVLNGLTWKTGKDRRSSLNRLAISIGRRLLRTTLGTDLTETEQPQKAAAERRVREQRVEGST